MRQLWTISRGNKNDYGSRTVGVVVAGAVVVAVAGGVGVAVGVAVVVGVVVLLTLPNS